MNPTNTPRTDALENEQIFDEDRWPSVCWKQMTDHARTLERECAALRAEMERLKRPMPNAYNPLN